MVVIFYEGLLFGNMVTRVLRFETLAAMGNYIRQTDITIFAFDPEDYILQINSCPVAERTALEQFGAVLVECDACWHKAALHFAPSSFSSKNTCSTSNLLGTSSVFGH